MSKGSKSKKKSVEPTGISAVDRLGTLDSCAIEDYVSGVSGYVRESNTLKPGPKKAGQIRLSHALARALADDLSAQLPKLKNRLVTHEQKVAGGLRTVNADVSESHNLDGLRLAVELKPINLAVGRALWNRFGDIRTFAVNIHLKFPFAVVGGVLVIPTYEEMGTKAAKAAEQEEEAVEEGQTVLEEELVEAEDRAVEESAEQASAALGLASTRRSTVHLIERAIDRLIRAGGRKSEAEAAHLLEGIAVVVYDPDTGLIDQNLPKPGSGLRWSEFVNALVLSYKARFED